MKYIPVSDTTRIIMVPGTKAQLTLRLSSENYRDKKNQILRPNGEFDHWATDAERFDRHTDDVLAKLAKCTGKHKRHVLRGGDGRKYPAYGERMTTAAYVKLYMTLNGNKLTDNFGTLSTNVQSWPDEPIEETLDHD